jgi:hypothetical protein
MVPAKKNAREVEGADEVDLVQRLHTYNAQALTAATVPK